MLLLTREAHLVSSQARAQPDDPTRWLAAQEAVARVAVVLGDAPDSADRKSLDALRAAVDAGLNGARSDQRLVEHLLDIRSASADDSDGSGTDSSYAAEFAGSGIDVDRLSPSEAGARIAHRPASVARVLVAALDYWNDVRKSRGVKESAWMRLVEIARVADRDPDRDALRTALLVGDRAEGLDRLRRLAGRAELKTWEPATLVLLANALAYSGDLVAGVGVLRQASGLHPGDASVHYDLGRLLEQVRPPQAEDAIRRVLGRPRRAARVAHQLAHALAHRGKRDEAEAIFHDLTLRRPDNIRHLTCLGDLLNDRGRGQEATAVLLRAVAVAGAAIRLNPGGAVLHNNLGITLESLGRLDEAIAEHREAIRLVPDYAARV